MRNPAAPFQHASMLLPQRIPEQLGVCRGCITVHQLLVYTQTPVGADSCTVSVRNRYYNPCVAKMKEAFHPGEPRYAAVHMRVEDDWVPFCQEKEIAFKDSPEYRACFGAAEIAETFMNTPALRENRNVLLLYAADNFTPDLEGRPDSMKPDPMKVRDRFTMPSCHCMLCLALPKGSMQSFVRWLFT